MHHNHHFITPSTAITQKHANGRLFMTPGLLVPETNSRFLLKQEGWQRYLHWQLKKLYAQ